MFRLRITEYFDSVVNEIDLYTETKIQSIKTQTEEDWCNKRRQEQINEVRRIERACLDHVNALKVEKEIDSEEWMKRVFVEYCFTVDYGLLYLVKANRYVEPRERRLLDVHLNRSRKQLKIQFNSQQCFGMTIKEFELNLLDFFLTESPLIDISSGLDQCCRIKMACVSTAPNTKQSPINLDFEDLKIQECSLSFSIENADQEKEAVNVIKYLMNRRGLIEKDTVCINYECAEPSQVMSELLQLIELKERVTFTFSKYDYSTPFPFGLLGTSFNLSNMLWRCIYEIRFDKVLIEDLEKAYRTCLHSPKDLILRFSATDSSDSDLTFLDNFRALESLEVDFLRCIMPLSCRAFSRMANLKTLTIYAPILLNFDSHEEIFSGLSQLEKLSISSFKTPFPLSSKTFSGLVNLKCLSLRGKYTIKPGDENELFTELTHLENLSTSLPLSRKTFTGLTNLRKLDISGSYSVEPEAFADLVHLKQLKMYVSKDTNFQVNSCSVEELDLSFYLDGVASPLIRFHLPKLASLSICFDDPPIVCDLEGLMSCFSHVKKLRIWTPRVEIMTRGWFRSLTNLEDLDTCIWHGHINSQTFEEFECLTHLRLSCSTNVVFDPHALHQLTSLQRITFDYSIHSTNKCVLEDRSIFDGLDRLETIEYNRYDRHSKSYVYFENLNRCILIIYS